MTFDEWIALIRDVAHTQDEIATLHFARALRFAPQTQELHARWRDVSAYAACLDLDAVAHVMANHGWRLNRADGGAPSRTVTSPDGKTFRLSPARYFATWANEMPRVTPETTDKREHMWGSARWWNAADECKLYPFENDARRTIWSFERLKDGVTDAQADAHLVEVRARIQHRAIVQYLRARLWMEP